MNALIVFSCMLAAASAGFVYPQVSYAGHHSWSGAHVQQPAPLPVHDTEEVAAAKAVHLAAHAAERARNYGYAHGYGVHQDNGPIDTPEVQIAKFQHQIAFEQAKLRNSNPELAKAAAPVDTPEVQVAKHEHLAAYAEAKYRNENPHIAHASGPVDTFEVQQAKVEHFAAHAQAQAQQHYGHHAQGPVDTPEVEFAKYQHYAAVAQAKYGHQSGPIDTPEVQYAKHQHFAAVAQAQAEAHTQQHQVYEHHDYEQESYGNNEESYGHHEESYGHHDY